MPEEIKNLRTYLRDLEAAEPQSILRIKEPIDCAYDLTAVQVKLEKQGLYPVVIAEKPIKVDGEASKYPVVTNLTASRRLSAAALGINPRRVAQEYFEKTTRTVDPVVISPSEAPVKEVIYKGDEVDLLQFPHLIHHDLDPGPYITSGYVVSTDPDSGVDNSAIQRLWVKDKTKMGYYPAPSSHAGLNMNKWWAQGKDMPVAIWFGHHPAALIAGQARLNYPQSHWGAMGGALEQPLRLVPTETFGDQLMVPADAEIVIEGWVPREVYEAEAPFGEFTGYSGPQRPSPIIRVTSITCRKDAIYHDYGVGVADMLVIGNFPLEARVYQSVRALIPELLNVHVPLSGRRFHIYLQVKKTRAGIGKDAILATLPCDTRLKHVFVVDEDVDIFDERQVLWAVATRTQWHRDVVTIKDMATFPLDPSLSAPGTYGTKGGIDATMPPPLDIGLPPQFSTVNKVPDEVDARIQLEAFASDDMLRAFPND